MSSANEILIQLKHMAGMSECESHTLARSLPHITKKHLQVGDPLFQGGEDAQCCYFIIEGECHFCMAEGVPLTLNTGYIGEEALIGFDQYMGDCYALSDMTVLLISAQAAAILKTSPSVLAAVKQSFSQRLMANAPSEGEAVCRNAPNIKMKEILGWLLLIVLPVCVYFSMLGVADIPDQRTPLLLSILCICVVMWVFSLAPDFVPAILAVLCILLMGLAPPEIALTGFSGNSFFMALSIFSLSTVIMSSGLSYRLLLLLLKIGPEHKAWYSFSLFLTGLIMTPLIPTANGRVAIAAPFLKEILSAFNQQDADIEAPRLSASTLSGVSLFSAVFMTSKSVNFIIYGLLPLQDQARFQWLNWFYAASVVTAFLALGYLLMIWLLFRNQSRPIIAKEILVAQLKLLGPMSASEWACSAGLVTLLVSFMTASIHHIAVPWIALSIMLGLLLFSFLNSKDFREKIDWGFLIFLGSLIGIVNTMKYIGLEAYLGTQLAWMSVYIEESFSYFILLLALAIFVVRLILPINATIVIFATLLIPFGDHYGISPWLIGFLILLLAESFIWPYQASYFMQFLSITGSQSQARHPRIMVFHLLLFVLKLLAIYASMPFWRSLGLI